MKISLLNNFNSSPVSTAPGRAFQVIPGRWQAVLTATAAAMLLLVFSSAVWAFGTYDGCATCHGDFSKGSYTSLQDGTAWGSTLMSGHGDFVGGRCNACHQESTQDGVLLNSSAGITYTKGCVGCHGRDEDVTGNCTGQSGSQGGVEAECGSAAGLRRHHESKVGPGTCNNCHTGDATPVGEHVNPVYYGLEGTFIKDSCDVDGTESQFGPTGLDNDGDGQRDGLDSDCSGGSLFTINPGLNDAWVSADAAFQGLFFTVFEDLGLFFLSWFTFDFIAPDDSVTAVFGAADQRWVTGLGTYSGDTVTMNVELTSGGIFNGSVPLATQAPGYGTITVVFISCNEALLTYNFLSVGLSGQMTLTRVVTDNVALCEAMAAP
jgi:hypothetical protein